MKKITILIIALIYSFCSLGQSSKKKSEVAKYPYYEIIKNYQKGIDLLHNKLCSYRKDLNAMDVEIKSYVKPNSNCPYTRKKTVKTLHELKLNKKLCDEALKRCEYNYSKMGNVFESDHLYQWYECSESIHALKTSITCFNWNDIEETIMDLIIDGEPHVLGHREMLLATNTNFKHVGYGYKIVKNGNGIQYVCIILIATDKGLIKEVNFNNSYINLNAVKSYTY